MLLLLSLLRLESFKLSTMLLYDNAKNTYIHTSPLALSFSTQFTLSYKIGEYEDSGLPLQGILPISAKKQ